MIRGTHPSSMRTTVARAIRLVLLACLMPGLGACAEIDEHIRALFGHPGDAGMFVDPATQGRDHFREGRFGLAVRSFELAVARHPRSIEALNGLAASYDRLGRYRIAERYYGAALALDPFASQTLNNLGYSYYLQGRLDVALAYLSAARADGKDGGVIRANLRRVEDALASRPRAPETHRDMPPDARQLLASLRRPDPRPRPRGPHLILASAGRYYLQTRNRGETEVPPPAKPSARITVFATGTRERIQPAAAAYLRDGIGAWFDGKSTVPALVTITRESADSAPRRGSVVLENRGGVRFLRTLDGPAQGGNGSR